MTGREEARFGAFSSELRGREISAALLTAGIENVRVIADIGCGDGAESFDLAAKGARVIGVDRDRERLTAGRLEAVRRGVRILYVEGDALHLPVADSRCDLVILYTVLETIPDIQGALRETARVLAPGGVVFVVTPSPHSPISLLDDPHTHLPFAHTLPHRFAAAYARAFGRRMPSGGTAHRIPTWRTLTDAADRAGLSVTLLSTSSLKLGDPRLIVSVRKQRIANWIRKHGLADALASRRAAWLVHFYDRYLARSWIVLLRRRVDAAS